MGSLEALLGLFRQRGLKITPQRRVILGLLAEDTSHPTIDALYQRVLAEMPDVSRTTVYNTLHELVDLGALVAVQGLGEEGGRYDINVRPHHHLFCTQCHALVDVERDFEGVHLSPEDAVGYRIEKHRVTFYGLCPNCQHNTKD